MTVGVGRRLCEMVTIDPIDLAAAQDLDGLLLGDDAP